jgi:hypothetical protein
MFTSLILKLNCMLLSYLRYPVTIFLVTLLALFLGSCDPFSPNDRAQEKEAEFPGGKGL